MESAAELTRIDPKPMSESPPRSSTFPRPAPGTGPKPAQDPMYSGPGAPETSPGLGLRLGVESKIPDDPSSPGLNIPSVTSPTQMGPDLGIYGPNPSYGAVPPANAGITTTAPRDIKAARSSAQYHLGELAALLRQRRDGVTQGPQEPASQRAWEERLRWQQGTTVSELNALIVEVKLVVKEAEGHRWRRWIVGGALGAFIPLVRRIFRRPEDPDDENTGDDSAITSSNDTEYAFHKSKGLLSRIKNGLLGTGRFAQIAFFVFAVLYVFSNEVTLRVARTVQKRLRKLSGMIERGEDGPEVEEGEKILEGWRWRILLW